MPSSRTSLAALALLFCGALALIAPTTVEAQRGRARGHRGRVVVVQPAPRVVVVQPAPRVVVQPRTVRVRPRARVVVRPR